MKSKIFIVNVIQTKRYEVRVQATDDDRAAELAQELVDGEDNDLDPVETETEISDVYESENYDED